MPRLTCENPTCCIRRPNSENDAGEWVLVHKGELAGIYRSFEAAHREAATRFNRRQCHIRTISIAPGSHESVRNFQTAGNKLFTSLQKFIRSLTRQLFPASEMAF